ncbi:unnamed protein product [Clavelina lepadiformis]|uniref:Uncharacterized protein n=1 Tax=Clavelina lepadiformis TaxID=159417 RepID=A0ABP0FY90_CLALP
MGQLLGITGISRPPLILRSASIKSEFPFNLKATFMRMAPSSTLSCNFPEIIRDEPQSDASSILGALKLGRSIGTGWSPADDIADHNTERIMSNHIRPREFLRETINVGTCKTSRDMNGSCLVKLKNQISFMNLLPVNPISGTSKRSTNGFPVWRGPCRVVEPECHLPRAGPLD